MNTTLLSLQRSPGVPKHSLPGFVCWLLASILSATCGGQVVIPEQNFKAGTYQGTIEVTASVDGLPETKTVSRIKGRSTGNSKMDCLGVPDLGTNVVASGDQLPVKLFSIEFSSAVGTFFFNEVINASGSGSGNSLQSLEVRKNKVTAEFFTQRLVNERTLELRVRVRLTRVGN